MTMTEDVSTTKPHTPVDEPAPGTGHEGQTFLVGDEVYLRAIESTDATYAPSWKNTVFPKSTEFYEKWIKEDMVKEERTATYLIIRKRDDVPVGSVKTHSWDPTFFLEPYVDPIYADHGQRWLAEALTLMLPWLVDEQHRPIAVVTVNSSQTAAIAALEATGARQTARFRDKVRIPGGRADELMFEYLNALWVKTLGDPNDQPVERSGTGEPRPVPPRVVLEGDPPKNAVMVGARVYLRPFEKKDADEIALWSRRETESFWSNGRAMHSAVGFATWTEGLEKEDPPEWIRFAVCLRENDELIGAVGIDEVDFVNECAESESELHRPEYRGGGYGSEAKHLLFDYAFNRLKLHSLQSYVIFPNTRSAAALRKQGYTEVGRLNWDYTTEGRFGNLVCFELLADDWRAMPRASRPDNNETSAS
ncbi:MAG: GNAT family N-acetyltransferase [Chloroflexia bacterium]|nr:GNAT family N-acetyltransferase [Chloroflexia bacterium]